MPTPQTVNIIALVITILLLLMMVKDKVFGLMAYTCISFTRPGDYFPFLASIRFEMIVAIIVLLVVFLSPESRRRLRISISNISRNLFIFLVVVNLSMLLSIDFETAFGRSWEFFKVYAFWMMIVSLVQTEKDLKLFLWTFCFLIAWIGYEPLYNYFFGILRERGETAYAIASTGRAAGHVALGIYLCQGLSYLWYLVIVHPDRKMKLIGFFLIFVCFSGIMVSGSRGAIVGFVVLFLLVSYFSKNRIKLLIGGSIVFILAMIIMGGGYISHMSTILEFGASDQSASSRIDGLRHGIEMLIRRPLLGVGPGCYPVARKMWYGWGLWSHNVYGQLAGDLGLAGIVSWGLFVYSYLKKCFLDRNYVPRDSWYYGIYLAVIVSNFVCFVLGFFAHTLYGYFWYMSAGIVVAMEELRKKNDGQPVL